MKRNFYLLIAIFISIIVYDLNSTCPNGYSSYQFIFSTPPCQIAVDVCYICPVTGLEPGWIKLAGIHQLGKDCDWPQDGSYDRMMQIIWEEINSYGTLMGLCTNSIPPCSTTLAHYKLMKDICWRKYIDADGYNHIFPCDNSAYCLEEWVYCWNPATGMFKQLIAGPTLYGTPTCTTKLGNIPDPDYPYFSGCGYVAISGCYP